MRQTQKYGIDLEIGAGNERVLPYLGTHSLEYVAYSRRKVPYYTGGKETPIVVLGKERQILNGRDK